MAAADLRGVTPDASRPPTPGSMAPLGLTETSEGLVRALTERVPVGIFVTNAVGECVYGNELVLRLTGQTLEESLGYGWIRGLHPEDAENVQQAWADAAAGRAEFSLEYRFLRPDGGVSWVAGTASDIRDPDGALLGLGRCLRRRDRAQAHRGASARHVRARPRCDLHVRSRGAVHLGQPCRRAPDRVLPPRSCSKSRSST